MSGSVNIRNTSLTHTTFRLILIRIRMDHKGDKTLPQNIAKFTMLEFEISD